MFSGLLAGDPHQPGSKNEPRQWCLKLADFLCDEACKVVKSQNGYIFFWRGGCRATLRHLGPAHQESPGPGPESPMQTGTSLNLGKPKHGGHVSTGVSQLPRHGCCKRQAVSLRNSYHTPPNSRKRKTSCFDMIQTIPGISNSGVSNDFRNLQPGTSYVRDLASWCEIGADGQCEIWREIR